MANSSLTRAPDRTQVPRCESRLNFPSNLRRYDTTLRGNVKRISRKSALSARIPTSQGAGPEHAHIHESIWQILSTRPGERFFLPEFGSRLPELVFQQNNVVFKALARQFIVDAVKRWEKRVVIESVEFSDDPLVTDRNVALIRLDYRIIRTQVRGNMVYPFVREV